HTGWSDWLRRNARTLQQVRDAIAQNGPMANADFEGRRARGGAGWWNWKPVQHALHYLWMSGALAIHSRRHFHKRFDLLERAMPDALVAEAVSAGEFRRWHVEREAVARVLHAADPARRALDRARRRQGAPCRGATGRTRCALRAVVRRRRDATHRTRRRRSRRRAGRTRRRAALARELRRRER